MVRLSDHFSRKRVPAAKVTEGIGERSEFSLSVSRALQILSLFSSDRPGLGVSEISKSLSLSKTSTLRFLQALRKVLRDVRTRGYSVIWETQSHGVGSVAAAVPRPGAKVVSVLSLGFATSQVTREELPVLGDSIRKAAAALARLLAQEEQKD